LVIDGGYNIGSGAVNNMTLGISELLAMVLFV
jgi:hypothetical protein